MGSGMDSTSTNSGSGQTHQELSNVVSSDSKDFVLRLPNKQPPDANSTKDIKGKKPHSSPVQDGIHVSSSDEQEVQVVEQGQPPILDSCLKNDYQESVRMASDDSTDIGVMSDDASPVSHLLGESSVFSVSNGPYSCMSFIGRVYNTCTPMTHVLRYYY